jgi:hypothetical protein
VLVRLVKNLRDRIARATSRGGAIPTILDVVDMDGSRRDIAIDVQIVEGLKALPDWDFDLSAVEHAYRAIDDIAAPAYHEQERAKLRALVEKREALENRGGEANSANDVRR